MSTEKLSEKAKKYSLSDEIIQKRENDRLSFIEKFPLEKIKDLSIDQFVQGTDENSFCYWLEFKKIGFGIGGGNASKFGIYKTKNKEKEVYATGYGKNKTFLNDNDAEQYFSELLSKILTALDYSNNDKIDKIKELDIPIWNMVLQKILSIYYPEKFLTIGSPTVLIKCAKELGLNEIELSSENSIQINYECKKAISNNPIYIHWPYEKIGSFIWEAFDGEDEKRKSKKSKQFWLYSPGENAYLWDEFYKEGIMGLGWDEIGDLSQFQNRQEIKKALVDAYGGIGSKKNDVSANDDFQNKINIGDVIIAKKGRGELLGYGFVTSDYIYDKNRKNYQKIRQVDWKLKGNWKVDFSLVLKTLTDITKYNSDHPDYETYHERLMGIMEVGNSTLKNKEKSDSLNTHYPLNTIFYGPPGTGKTYNTVLRAAEIIEKRKIDSFHEALEIFKANLHNQIEFITFHQNYSYEDFIQGLRPDTENDKELTFERKDGVFKVMADKALKNITASEQPPVVKKTFEESFNEFVNPLVEGEVEEIEVKMKKVSYFITAITNKSIEFRKTSGGTEHTLSISTLRKMYDAESVLDIQGLSSYYSPLLDELLKNGKDSSGKKEIVQRKNYVIIIDEINRANISRVFGELITLIESDKRSHGGIPMEARLPSGDTFMVPSNLYIIGTMNTADKSIALLDIALRRRFEFEPMYPKYSEDGLNVNDENVLKSINQSIISDKGHDFQIGHSYFMDSKEDPYDLKRRMNVKVIPLLLEYFMNDSKAVTQIISKALSDTKFGIVDKSWPLKISEKND
jgi:5-methylcytosine-specific restriction enzyme B